MYAETERCLLGRAVRNVALDRVEDLLKLGAEEYRNDGGRCLVRAETVVV